MDNIIIENDKDRKNGFTVRQGDKYSDGLTYYERLGMSSALTMPTERRCIHWMKTEEQWKGLFANVLSAKNKHIKNEV